MLAPAFVFSLALTTVGGSMSARWTEEPAGRTQLELVDSRRNDHQCKLW